MTTNYNSGSLSGNISVSAEYLNGKIEKINEFELISLDNDYINFVQNGDIFTTNEINGELTKIIGISYVSSNNVRIVKPIEISLRGLNESFEYDIPNLLPHSISSEFKIEHKIGDSVYDETQSNKFIVEDLTNISGKLSNSMIYDDVNYKSVSYLEKETMVKCPSFRLEDVSLFHTDGGKITVLNIAESYPYIVKATFIENKERKTFIIPNSDIISMSFSGFKNLISCDETKIVTDYTKRLYVGIVIIEFIFNGKKFKFQKQIALKGHLTAKVSGTFICSNNGDRIEKPFNVSFILNDLEGGDDEIYTRTMSVDTNINLDDTYLIAIKDFGFDQNISGDIPNSIEFKTSTENSYNLTFNKLSNDIVIPKDECTFLKADAVSKIRFTIKFKGTDVLA